MKQQTVCVWALICMLTLLGSWGCGPKEPSEADKKQQLVGQHDKRFDPGSVPAEYRAGFEKWQKGNGAKVSGPATVTGPTSH